METKDYLEYIAAIDMMDCDDNSLYFLTAKGKNFYDRLIKRGFLAFTAMKGAFTFGGAEKKEKGYFITDACVGCGNCMEVCPAGAVEER